MKGFEKKCKEMNIADDILKIAPKLKDQINTLIESAQNTNNTDNITEFRDNLDELKDALYENVEKLSDKQSLYKPEIDETIVYAMVDNFFSDILTEYANNCPGKHVGRLRKEIEESMKLEKKISEFDNEQKKAEELIASLNKESKRKHRRVLRNLLLL